MPLRVDGDPGYGSVAGGVAPAPSESLGGSETAPLLIPIPEPAGQRRAPPSGPMSKEELEQHADTPWWRKLRSRLVLLFWLGWLSMLATAIAIIASSPRPVAPDLHWWQKALFYRMQPALLLSSTGDGTKGINGVRDQLPYLRSLGVGALVLEGLFPRDSPPSSLTQFNSSLGTLPQFQQLVTEGHSLGIKILLDLCHLDLSEPVQRDGPTETPGPVENALQFWLEQGSAGFAICDTDVAYSEQILLEWRAVVKNYDQNDHERILMVRQVWQPVPELNDTSSAVNSSLVELVTQSLLPSSPRLLSTQEVAVAVETVLLMPQRQWPSWTVGGAVPGKLQRILMTLSMTLPGTPVINYGEEISATQNASVTEKAQIDLMGDPTAGDRKAKRSALALFHSLSHSRSREEGLLFGNFTFLPLRNSSSSASEVFTNSSSPSSSSSSSSPPPPSLLAFLRSWGCVHFLVLLNLGPDSQPLDLSGTPGLPAGGVYVTSTGLDRVGSLSLATLTVSPQEAIVIKLFEAGSYS